MTEVPVNPEVLRWARNFRRLSEEDAAARLGITEDELRSLEKGSKKPSLTQFENIAAKYKLPQSTLFRRTRPKNPPEPADFRTIGGTRARESFELSVAISNVRSLLTQLQRVAEDDGEYRAPKLPAYSLKDDPSELGERERERLGVTFDTQREWRNTADAFRQWRRAIESQGVSVFLQKFPLDDCRGFTIYEANKPPCIIVNKGEEFDVARVFTLIHEYCHLLVRKPGISDENSRNPIEAFCNRFTAAFLMPKQALRILLPVWPNEPVEWSSWEVSEWARLLKVSRQALAIRLEELGLAPIGFNKRFVGHAPASKRSTKSRGNAVSTRISEIGYNYAGTVLNALDRGAINKATAVDALGLSAHHFGRVREAIVGKRGLMDAAV